MLTVRAFWEAWLAVPPATAVIWWERTAAEGRRMTPLGTISCRCFDICRGCASYSAYRDIYTYIHMYKYMRSRENGPCARATCEYSVPAT